MKKMNLAILGAGRIAGTMAGTVSQMEEVNLYAIASRDESRARAFAEKYGVQKAFGSYEEMLLDEQVDLVYIATPHALHCEQAKLCVEYGKPVLCEKAFAMNAGEAREMIEFAHEKGVFITEAMWTRYTPQAAKLRELACGEAGTVQAASEDRNKAAVEGADPDSGKDVEVRSKRPCGRIGEIVGLTANLGYKVMHKERLIRPELGGGALLDLGVYTMNFATWILGDEVQSFSVSMVPHDTGVDKSEFVSLAYPDGTVAGLFNTMEAVTDRRGIIFGTEGRIEVENVNNYGEIRIYNNHYERTETIPLPPQLTGYEYEVLACKRALEQGKLECEEMPHAHTIRVMELLDAIRERWER